MSKAAPSVEEGPPERECFGAVKNRWKLRLVKRWTPY